MSENKEEIVIPNEKKKRRRRRKRRGRKKNVYKEDQRLFGNFKCPQCSRAWSSANSWVNMGQECRVCLINVLPHVQHPLQRRKNKDINRKQHLDDLCEKCKSLGYCCRDVKPEEKKPKRRRRRRGRGKKKATVTNNESN